MANKPLSQLPEADPLDGTELLKILQGGNSRRATADMVAAFLLADAGLMTLIAAAVVAGGLLVPTTEAGAAYTIQDSDKTAAKRLTNAGQVTVNVPLNATEAVPIGARVRFICEGAGGAIIVPEVGVTLISRDDALTALEGAIFELHKLAADTWAVVGDVEA